MLGRCSQISFRVVQYTRGLALEGARSGVHGICSGGVAKYPLESSSGHDHHSLSTEPELQAVCAHNMSQTGMNPDSPQLHQMWKNAMSQPFWKHSWSRVCKLSSRVPAVFGDRPAGLHERLIANCRTAQFVKIAAWWACCSDAGHPSMLL